MFEMTGEDLRKAVKIGILLSDYSNMGLSSTDVGFTAGGSIGKFFQKFNYWGLQKTGRDARVTKNLIILAQSYERLGKTPWLDGRAIAKMIYGMVKPGKNSYWNLKNYNKLNIAQKQKAQAFKFMTIGVLPAVFMNMIMWGPLGNMLFFSGMK